MTCHVKDIIGAGEIIGHFAQIIMKFSEYWTTREERKQVNRGLYLSNLRALLEIAREFRLSAEELRSWETVNEKELQKLLPANSVECVHCRVKGAQSLMDTEKHGIVPVTIRLDASK
jgi:hypothetical protein